MILPGRMFWENWGVVEEQSGSGQVANTGSDQQSLSILRNNQHCMVEKYSNTLHQVYYSSTNIRSNLAHISYLYSSVNKLNESERWSKLNKYIKDKIFIYKP